MLQKNSNRFIPLDILRGYVMILMALRHAEIFLTSIVTPPELWGGPLPRIQEGWPYWSRFIGHMCPTGFFFLMGIGMTLFTKSRIEKGRSMQSIIRHFILRGVILVTLQFFMANPLWFFGNPSRIYPPHIQVIFYFGVLFSLGVALIINSLFLRLKSSYLLFICLGVFLIPHICLPAPDTFNVKYPVVFRALLIAGQTGHTLVRFPVIPWFAVTGLGILFGRALLQYKHTAYKFAGIVGVMCLILFFIIRLNNGFGNLRPYLGGDWRLFFFITKMPPSIVYITVTLGIICILLWCIARFEPFFCRLAKPLIIYGQTALFFYFSHMILLAIIGQILFRNGASLFWMHVFWLLVLGVLYKPCKIYREFKQKQKIDSLWRLF